MRITNYVKTGISYLITLIVGVMFGTSDSNLVGWIVVIWLIGVTIMMERRRV